MYQRKCKCPSMSGLLHHELIETVVPHNCCAPYYLCPVLDKALRESEVQRDRRHQYNKRLKKQGFTQDQIDTMPERRRRRRNGKYEGADLEL